MITETFTSSTTWTCPAGVTSVNVELWGGGGGGAAWNSNSNYYGGGGGAYSKKNNISVTAGSAYTVNVGAQGIHQLNNYGTNGGDSYFIDISTILAKGGEGGDITNGLGGAAGSGVGDTKYSGGNAGYGGGTTHSGGGGGGAAGDANNGNNGQSYPTGYSGGAIGITGGGKGGDGGSSTASSDTIRGKPGDVPGGGGGGSCATSGIGGDGAGGKVILSYIVPTVYPSAIVLTLTQPEITLPNVGNIFLPSLSLTLTQKIPELQHYWTKESTHSPNWVKE